MYLSDIPGQTALKAYFHKIVKEDRVPHALMVTGGEGRGQLALALGLATLLQCPNKSDTGACKECPSCKKAHQLIHPDIHLAFPVVSKEKKKREDTTSKDFLVEFREFVQAYPYGDMNQWLQHLNAVDKRANINKAECAAIIKNLGLMTYEGQYKVQIIWQADYLMKEGNRLLKLIEEPTPDTIIILIVDEISNILNTLSSRSQLISVPPIEDAVMTAYISEHFDLSAEDTKELAFMAAGSLRKANLLGIRQELNYSEELLYWLRLSYAMDPEKIARWVEAQASKGKQETITFLEYGLHFFREYLLLINTRQADKLRLTEKEKTVAMNMTKLINLSKTQQIQSLFEKSIGHINRNLAMKALMMAITLQINGILRSEVNNFVS